MFVYLDFMFRRHDFIRCCVVIIVKEEEEEEEEYEGGLRWS